MAQANIPMPPDVIESVLGDIAQIRSRLLESRARNPKEYDRLLKQAFPVDVLNLLESSTIEMANRVSSLLLSVAELHAAVHEDDDGGEDGDEPDEEIEAARTVLRFVRTLPNLPEEVMAAVGTLEDSGLLDDDEDEAGDEGAAGDEGEGEDEPEPEPESVSGPTPAPLDELFDESEPEKEQAEHGERPEETADEETPAG